MMQQLGNGPADGWMNHVAGDLAVGLRTKRRYAMWGCGNSNCWCCTISSYSSRSRSTVPRTPKVGGGHGRGWLRSKSFPLAPRSICLCSMPAPSSLPAIPMRCRAMAKSTAPPSKPHCPPRCNSSSTKAPATRCGGPAPRTRRTTTQWGSTSVSTSPCGKRPGRPWSSCKSASPCRRPTPTPSPALRSTSVSPRRSISPRSCTRRLETAVPQYPALLGTELTRGSLEADRDNADDRPECQRQDTLAGEPAAKRRGGFLSCADGTEQTGLPIPLMLPSAVNSIQPTTRNQSCLPGFRRRRYGVRQTVVACAGTRLCSITFYGNDRTSRLRRWFPPCGERQANRTQGFRQRPAWVPGAAPADAAVPPRLSSRPR